VSQHAACPFGAKASVHAWERVGAAITHIARKYLKIALLRYVDDLFAAERCVCLVCVVVLGSACVRNKCRKETMEHAVSCMARLIRVLLGPTAVADQKLAFGARLDVLGVDIKMSKRGYKCCPTKRKVRKWLKTLQQAVDEGRLAPGEASKLAGRLSWGSSQMFRLL
jgi:hypothetical protein